MAYSMNRRSRLDQALEILRVLYENQEMTITNIMYAGRFSEINNKQLIAQLIASGYVILVPKNNAQPFDLYRLTVKGIRTFEQLREPYNDLRNAIWNFQKRNISAVE